MIKVVLIADCGAFRHSKNVDCFSVTEEDWANYLDDTKAWDHMSEYAWDFAVENARSYGFEPESYREFFDNEEDYQFTDGISGHFELYDPEVHDRLFSSSDEMNFREL